MYVLRVIVRWYIHNYICRLLIHNTFNINTAFLELLVRDKSIGNIFAETISDVSSKEVTAAVIAIGNRKAYKTENRF